MAGADTAVVIPSAGGPSLRTRSGPITKGYCELGVEDPKEVTKDYCELSVEDPEENFAAVLPRVLPTPLRKKNPPELIDMRRTLLMMTKDGYGKKTAL